MITWELRYRSPRTIENVFITTFTTDEVEAKQLADRYLADLGSPAIRFVRLRQIMVADSSQHPDLVAEWGPTGRRAQAKAAAPAPRPVDDDEDEGPARVPPMSGDLIPSAPPPAPLAEDDEGIEDAMSGPRVAKPKTRRSA